MKVMTALLAIGLLSSGCASIVKGTDQNIAINTDPNDATCTVKRNGATISVIEETPHILLVPKSRNDLAIACKKQGYEPSLTVVNSEGEVMTAGNLIFGGLIGLGVDAATGAINKYPENVTIVMRRAAPSEPAPELDPLGLDASRNTPEEGVDSPSLRTDGTSLTQ